ncbi:LCP family protein [Vagococcus coleopterorum]|uniref:LCP family protein n=1 Tax=Vagococcus coleopterorum TaxID=2714946 RepID=A0A6G8AKY2_9ENTE|nr:LCP family protein [Vagococcus coleopterorum]QIL45647.1 LCP family protein [Vagococcus coleopterorum]
MNKDEINKLLRGDDYDFSTISDDVKNEFLEKSKAEANIEDTHYNEETTKEVSYSEESAEDVMSDREAVFASFDNDYSADDMIDETLMAEPDKKTAKKNKKDEKKALKQREKELKTELKEVKKARKRKSGNKRFVKWIILLLLLSLVGGLGVAAYNLYAKTDKVIANAFRPRENASKLNENIDPLKDPISILVLGVDNDEERDLGSTRTDTMMLMTVNPSREKITMTTIPRDTYTQINSQNFVGKAKINSAFAYGGIDSAVDSVEYLFADKDIDPSTGAAVPVNVTPINYYMTVDFKAFEEIIDALGGIELDVPYDISENYEHDDYLQNPGAMIIPKGKQVLKGKDALVFARIRKVDDDIKRGERQQQVVAAAVKKATSIGSIPKLQKMVEAVDGHFTTDMDMTVMKKIAESGLTKNYKIEPYTFDFTNLDLEDGQEAIELTPESLAVIKHRIRLNLGLDEEDAVMDAADFKVKSYENSDDDTTEVSDKQNSETESFNGNTTTNDLVQ